MTDEPHDITELAIKAARGAASEAEHAQLENAAALDPAIRAETTLWRGVRRVVDAQADQATGHNELAWARLERAIAAEPEASTTKMIARSDFS